MNFKHDQFEMVFVHTLYILIVVLAKNKEKCHAQGYVIGLEDVELAHRFHSLNPPENFRLVKDVYEQIQKELSENLNNLSTSPKTCSADFIQRTNDYPRTKESGGRPTMETARKLLGYPKSAKYVKEKHRSINLYDSGDYDLADILEFPEHELSRRHASKNDKHLSVNAKKKKKKRTRQERFGHSATRRKRIHDPIGTSAKQATIHKNSKLRKKENKVHDEKCYLKQHQSTCISIIFILLFIILCLIAAYYLRRRNRVMTRGTRFKHNWNENKEDKDTSTDHVEWNDEVVCSCSDVKIACTGKCPICNRIYDIFGASNKHMNSIGVQKGKDKQKKKRFNFLQKSFRDKKKEKDLENRDRKKIVEKAVLKKRPQFPSTLQGDQQCACCKCNLNTKSIDKMIREKKENEKKLLYKLKTKKRKEKKRKKDEIRRAEKNANETK